MQRAMANDEGSRSKMNSPDQSHFESLFIWSVCKNIPCPIISQPNFYVHTSSEDKAGKSYSDQRSVSEPIRNPPFGAAFVKTLGLMKDPDEIWTLGK